MSATFRLPAAARTWTIADARVPTALLEPTIGGNGSRTPDLGIADHDGLAAVDIAIVDGRIDRISSAGALPATGPVLQRPGLVLPCFVDAHTHLDKGHIWPRAPNPDGSFEGALATVPVDRAAHWTANDVATRMEFSLRTAYAHGTRAIRTHLDSALGQTRISWPVFAETRERWRGRIELQASPLFGIDLALDDAHMRDIADMVGEFGHCLGAVTYPGPALRPGLDRLFRLAADRGFELDFHADETNDPAVNTLAAIAETALAFGFPQRILVGHCCSLALMDPDTMRRTIDLVARAGLSVVSLPLCNMYLQDRDKLERTPRWRGVTAIKELRAAGVPVMIASDNTRDPFYAYGDLDMLEVWREGTRIAHLDHPVGPWADIIAATPATALGLDRPGRIRVGDPADLVILPARSLSELLARPRQDRIVIRSGRPIDTALPAYAQLDHLEGLAP
ncbi:cytosine deaminase [Lichenihabitans psoromatis]|uniref:cytosine deaminase n=1 Tax=Lichenihabitans psoromatis TaxID=2528642 RepID=UPI0010385836|nr:cytosine deaminase [Lichenihabitans psoromatis]